MILNPTGHVATSEARGYEAVGGLVGRFVESRAGCPDPGAVEGAILHAGRAGLDTTVVCLENSHNNAGGIAVDPAGMAAVSAVAHRHGAAVHLDGARLLNAALARGVPATRLAESVDTVSLSLGKGLCAPGGALLAGPPAVIDRARRHLRTIGAASFHKAGVIAAAGIVALESMIPRLADDNARARRLATGLAGMPRLRVNLETVQTNIVLVDTPGPGAHRRHPARAPGRPRGPGPSPGGIPDPVRHPPADRRRRGVARPRRRRRVALIRAAVPDPPPDAAGPRPPRDRRLTFALSHLVPTDPARAALGFDAAPDMVEQYRREAGLDRPLPVQYVLYLRNLLRGDLGVSIMTRRSVSEDLGKFVPATLELTLASLVISVALGSALGVLAAVRRGGVIDALATAGRPAGSRSRCS